MASPEETIKDLENDMHHAQVAARSAEITETLLSLFFLQTRPNDTHLMAMVGLATLLGNVLVILSAEKKEARPDMQKVVEKILADILSQAEQTGR